MNSAYDEASIGGRPDPSADLYPGRRQLGTLTAGDLAATGVWWFPGPDGHLSGPDLETVMPLDTSEAADDGSVAFPDGRFLLRAVFTLADGAEVPGHLTYAPDDAGSLRDREPTLVTPTGQIPLWHGVLVPDEEDVAEWLGWLGKTREETFPLSWRAAYHPPGDGLAGSLPGFAIVRDGRPAHT